MKINAAEKALLLAALETEKARVKRAANAEKNLAIRDIHGASYQSLETLYTKISMETV